MDRLPRRWVLLMRGLRPDLTILSDDLQDFLTHDFAVHFFLLRGFLYNLIIYRYRYVVKRMDLGVVNIATDSDGEGFALAERPPPLAETGFAKVRVECAYSQFTAFPGFNIGQQIVHLNVVLCFA